MPICPFCNLAANQRQQFVVLESEHCFFIQEPQKVLMGSGLIIPKKHRETVFDLSPDEWADTYHLLNQARELIDREYHPDGYNLGWNNGTAAGQEIFHVHLHIIPRFQDEPLAGKGIRHWLKQESNLRST